MTTRLTLFAAALAVLASGANRAAEPPPQDPQAQAAAPRFGGAYAGLGERRQELVADWVARFNEVTGQRLAPEPFYDTKVRLSAKTTFDAVTNALMTTSLTDASGDSLGDALDLLERVELVRGQMVGASGDRQFRMYARLKEGATDLLDRSQQFKRGADNTIYHKGYPINYRQQGGAPSIQISVATDRRRADVDVDYRSSGFPAVMFNGHLTAANSDVRAGNNYDRHTNRWAGFRNWWRGIFGIGGGAPVSAPDKPPAFIPEKPRAGNKTIDVMVGDFLKAWLVDADIPGAMSYLSERAYACLAQDGDDRDTFDVGMAPIQLMMQLKAAHEDLGKHDSLDGLVVGVRLSQPGLRVVRQPHHAQFVVYSVPDDIAERFDCESRLTLADSTKPPRAYGRYFGSTFYISGQRDVPIALLWARDNGYWKIASWQAEPEEDDADLKTEVSAPAVPPSGPRMSADATLVEAAKDFLESWLVRKDYDRAFKYLAPASYACYNLVSDTDAPAVSSAEAGPLIRGSLERAGERVGKQTSLSIFLASVQPFHPAIRLLNHPHSQAFALASVPNAIASAADCATRARGERFTGDIPLEYGNVYGMNFRFRTKSGETPVLRMLWMKEHGAWRITTYDVEYP